MRDLVDILDTGEGTLTGQHWGENRLHRPAFIGIGLWAKAVYRFGSTGCHAVNIEQGDDPSG